MPNMELSKANSSSPKIPIGCVDISSDSILTESSGDDNQTDQKRQYLKKNIGENRRKQKIAWKVSTVSSSSSNTDIPRTDITLNQDTTHDFFDDFNLLEATTSTAHKKRTPSNVSVSDLTLDPSLLPGCSKKKVNQRSKSNNACSTEINFDDTFTNEDRLRTALKQFRFIKKENETWIDANTHTFNGDDITKEDDEKRGTYNLEKSVIDLDTLKSLCENDGNVSAVQTEKKRSSIGQRISKNKSKCSLSPKLSIGFKAKAKLQKFRRSKEHIEGVVNSFSTSLSKKCKKSVAFDNTVSSINLSKIKRTKMPNFAQIHQRQLQRSENIIDYIERTNVRAKLLLSGSKPTTSHNVSAKSPTVARKNLLDALTSEKKEFNKSGNTKGANTPPTSKKKGVTYATPPAVQNRSPKTFAKTPGKNILGKKPTTPLRDAFSRKPLEVSVKTPQKEVLTKTPVKIPNNRMHTSSGMVNRISINNLVQPSTSNTTQEALFTTKNQSTSNKTQPSIPKMSRIPIRIKGASSKMSTNQNAVIKAANSKLLRTATEVDNKENKKTTAKNVMVGFKARPDRGALKVVVANKIRLPKVDNIEDRRKKLNGVRSNRRFDLLMKLRSN